MENRWIVLAVLFFVRSAMGFQFQSVASVSPFLVEALNIDYTRLGMLIGLYQLPGFVLALPGGLIGKRFGDKRVVMAALAMMVIGGLAMGASQSYSLSVVGRLVSGAGAILLNVILTKIIADWFAGKEIVTAMAVLMSSWPFGISLGLIFLGRFAAVTSWQYTMYLAAGTCLLAFVLVAAFYRSQEVKSVSKDTELRGLKFSRQEFWLIFLSSLVWTLFNVGFIAIPSFAPDLLRSKGYTVAAAASMVSMVTWIIIFSVQFGGYIAEKIKRPNTILVACFIGIGSSLCLLPSWPYPLTLLIWLGIIFGPPAGIIVALPAEVLQPQNRSVGMGLFWSIFYGGMMALTSLAGFSRDVTQSAAAPIVFAGLLLLIAILIFAIFRVYQAHVKPLLAE
jgi:predicted MFS family arabinose efflux permease